MLNINKNQNNSLVLYLNGETTYNDPYFIFEFNDVYNRKFVYSLPDISNSSAYNSFNFFEGSTGSLYASGTYKVYESLIDSSIIDASMNLLETGDYKFIQPEHTLIIYDPSIQDTDTVFDPSSNKTTINEDIIFDPEWINYVPKTTNDIYLKITNDRADNLVIGDVNNNISIDSSGNLKLNGSATQFTDLRFPATTTKQGANFKPDFDYTNVGLLFPQNDESEKVYMHAQFGHERKPLSNIHPHIHLIQSSATVPVFKMDYRWYGNGQTVPSYTTVESDGIVFPYTGGSMLQIVKFDPIPELVDLGISSMMDIIVYRKTGTGPAGDVLAKEFDIHYEMDSLGSNSEYVK